MNVKVILHQDVPNLGKTGEAHEVSAGYFRNFLQPRGLAIEASGGRMKTVRSAASQASAKEARETDQTRRLAAQLGSTRLRFPVRVGEQGRMYGSITAKDVADELKRSAEVEVDRHKIVLSEPLRSPGEHSVTIRLDHGVDAEVTVDLVPEAAEAG